MSRTSSTGCMTCRARRKKCDETRGPAGCRRCAYSGIKCGGYLASSSRIPKPKHSSRGNDTTHQGHSSSEHIESAQITLSTGSSVSSNTPRSGYKSSTIFPIHDGGCDSGSLEWSSSITIPCKDTNLYSRLDLPHGQPPALFVGQSPTPVVQLLTPPVEGRVGTSTHARPIGPMSTGQASLFRSIFSLAHDPPALPHTPECSGLSVIHSQPSTRREESMYTWRQETSSSHSQAEPTVDLPDPDDEDPDDSEKILVGMLDELVLDREVESNIVPFVAHAFASWISRFAFEPTRSGSLARATIVRGHSFGPEIYQKMVSAANAVFAISKSTDYELTYFTIFYQQLVEGVLEARARSELTREAAMKAMESSHELISITSKVASLATVLNLMNLYAPVFRRACPESGDKLVNLPRRLTAVEVTLRYFACYDVLQSVITHRPMFFRYGLNILTPQDDELLNADDRPGLRWSIGIPDRLLLALARINILMEDYGSSVDKEVVRELVTEIERACKPIVTCNPKEDPILMIRRLVVQEIWSLAGYVYLYMGLSGADSNDARVVKVQRQFMRLLETVKPRRHPDAFLIFPMVILGIATSSPVDQSILFARLWGVCECGKPGTVGNDVVRMLNDIWERTKKRPAVWSDLRVACLKITGM